MLPNRVRAVVLAATLILFSAGCGLEHAFDTPARSTEPAPAHAVAEVRRTASGYASDVTAWIGAGPFEVVSTNTRSDPVQCYDRWAAGGSGVESVFRVPLSGSSHPDAYERVRAGMRARGIEISFDGAGRPGPSAVLLAGDRRSGYGLRLFSALVTPDRPVSDAIVIEVSSPCFTAVGATVSSSGSSSTPSSVPSAVASS